MAFLLKSALQIVDSLLQPEANVSLHSVPLLWNLWKSRNAVVAGVPGSSACCGLDFSPALGAGKLVSCVLITGLSHLKISWLLPGDKYRGCRILHLLLNALETEMMACVKAIEFAAEVIMGCIITQTDAYVFLIALQSNEYDASRHGGEIPLCSDLF